MTTASRRLTPKAPDIDAPRRAAEPEPDDRLGWRLVNANLPDHVEPWVGRLLSDAWRAIQTLRADSTTKAATIAAQGQEIERLEAERDELRLTLAAEQGRPEGAPHPDWRCKNGLRERDYPDGDSATVFPDGSWLRGRFGGGPCRRGHSHTQRAAMLAADAALSGEATASPSPPDRPA